jgi:hypothetical protein
MGEQESFGVIQLALGRRQFQVEIQGIATPFGFRQGQRSLAGLTRAE